MSLDDVLTMPSTCVCPNVLDGSNDLPLSARYALHPLACIAIDGGHRRVIRSRESESVKDCS